MSRLNKTIREKIIDNAVTASTIPVARKALIPRVKALAEKVRIDILGGVEVAQELDKYAEKVKAIPLGPIDPKWVEDFKFNKKAYLFMVVGGFKMRLGFSGGLYHESYADFSGIEGRSYLLWSNLDTCLPFPCDNSKKYHPESELGAELLEIIDAVKSLKTDEEVLRARVSDVVHSVGSVKKLLEVWPNAKDLLPPSEAKVFHAPAVIDTKSLDQLIGLPK